MPEYLQLEQGLLLLGIFIVSVSGFHYFLLQTAQGSPSAFVRGYMVSMVLKFFFYILLLAAFLALFKTHQKAFVLHFVLYYTVYTVLEVTMISKELMKNKGEKK